MHQQRHTEFLGFGIQRIQACVVHVMMLVDRIRFQAAKAEALHPFFQFSREIVDHKRIDARKRQQSAARAGSRIGQRIRLRAQLGDEVIRRVARCRRIDLG